MNVSKQYRIKQVFDGRSTKWEVYSRAASLLVRLVTEAQLETSCKSEAAAIEYCTALIELEKQERRIESTKFTNWYGKWLP